MLGIEDTDPGIRGPVGEKPRNPTIVLYDHSMKGSGSWFDGTQRQECLVCQAAHRFPEENSPRGQVQVGGQDLASLEDVPQPLPECFQSLEQGVGGRERQEGAQDFLTILHFGSGSAPSFIWQPENV